MPGSERSGHEPANVVLRDLMEARNAIAKGEASLRAIMDRVRAVAVSIRQDAATCRTDGEEDEAAILEAYAHRIEEALG